MWAFKSYLQNKRHKRLVFLFNLPKGSATLDLSCGDGHLLSILHQHAPHIQYNGVDLSEKSIAQAASKYPFASFSVADAGALRYPPHMFEAVFSCMSLHHYPDAQAVFSEAARVLKPNGYFYCIDLLPRQRLMQLFENAYGCSEPYHFERYYRQDEVEMLANKVGLVAVRVCNLSMFGGIRFAAMQKVHRDDRGDGNS